MREILFRGKDVDGKWVEGCCIVDEMDTNKVYIGYIFGSDGRQPHDTDVSLVDPKTVCQYTGLTDKNGRKIFEGDIVRIDGQQELFTVVWVCDAARFGLQSKTQLLYFEFGLGSRIEVIGNIHENADLLKE